MMRRIIWSIYIRCRKSGNHDIPPPESTPNVKGSIRDTKRIYPRTHRIITSGEMVIHMGCPMCDWKTASLLIAGLIVMLFAPEPWMWLGLVFAIAAYAWALWPKKSCETLPDGSRSCKVDTSKP